MFLYSAGGAVMPDAISYGQDCTYLEIFVLVHWWQELQIGQLHCPS